MKRPQLDVYRLRWILSMAIVLSSAPLYGADILLQYGHTAGTSLTYQFSLDTPTPQNSQYIEFELVRDIPAVDGDGIMEIHSSINNGTVTNEGVSKPLSISGDIMTTMMAPNGAVSETTATGDLGTLFGQSGVSTSSTSPDILRSLGILEFPETLVDAGATWNVSKNHTFDNGDSLQITYDYTFDSYVEFGGYECARILINAQPQFSFYQDFPDLRHGMQVNGEISVSGELLFAHAEGRVVRLSETITANQVAITVGYDGMTSVVPSYRQTTISLEIQ